MNDQIAQIAASNLMALRVAEVWTSDHQVKQVILDQLDILVHTDELKLENF